MAKKAARSTPRRAPAKRPSRPLATRKARTAATHKPSGANRKPHVAAAKHDSHVGDDAVRSGSGRGWAEWFALLDQAGAHNWKHKDIAAYLYDELECPGWWNQMVAVGYEQARGLRAVNETASGFQVSCSRTIEAPVRAAYAAWAQQARRRRWLGAVAITVRSSTPDKTMRITWVDGTSSVEVYFLSKGAGRSQVSVQHRKLASARAVASMRGFWSDALERLRNQLEA